VATVALAMGAKVMERHFKLDRFMEGPDHILSSDPGEMAELVRLGHLIPTIQGGGEKNIAESEMEAINRHKKSLYAKVNIRQGEKITTDKIIIKGPGGGILPKYLEVVIGRISKIDIEADHPILWDSF
jgi:sialic acid synthase SpsE